MIRILVAAAILLALVAGVRFAVLASASRRPPAGGAAGARLAPCPERPNCVSSRSGDPRRSVEPLAYDGEAAEAMAAARRAVESLPRTRVVTVDDSYLHAEARSAVFGFVDDLELAWREEGGAFDVRSASRQGHSDLGVNRRRVEKLRRLLAASGGG